jgi:RecG-like helicase
MEGPHRKGLRSVWERLTSSAEEEDAAQLLDTTEQLGLVPAAECCDRQRVTVHGSIRSVRMLPRAGSPALEVELFDGSGSLTLVWLGRRRIHGVECGRTLTASGLVSIVGDQRIIYNPRYELDPAPAA